MWILTSRRAARRGKACKMNHSEYSDGLSGRYLPFHPSPKDGELFSSWLSRVAKGNHPKMHTFCHLIWPKKQIWTRDIDQCADEKLVGDLCRLTGTKLISARKTMLSSFQGRLFERHQPNGRTVGILPLGIFHRLRRRFGQQYCPLCLSDEIPYYRKEWRLSHVTCCLRHKIRLVDRCDQCLTPIIPYRSEMVECHNCAFDLREANCSVAGSLVIRFETKNKIALKNGYSFLGAKRIEISIAYFDIVRQLLKVLSLGPRSQDLRNCIAKKYGGNPAPVQEDPNAQVRKFDHLSSASRHRVSSLLAPLILNWPDAFIEACEKSRNYSSQILKDMPVIRYHLWQLSKDHLSGSPAHPKR